MQYMIGDASDPIGEGARIIAHVTNDVGAWGRGFVVSISKRWPNAEDYYRKHRPILGRCQFVPVGLDMMVANMCAQRGLPSPTRRMALDYTALGDCLFELSRAARKLDATVHMPRILCKKGIDVTVYDLRAA